MYGDRNHSRWSLSYCPRVFDRHTQVTVGHMVNVSPYGMMLVSKRPILPYRNYHLAAQFCVDDGVRINISLDAHSVWNQRDINPELYDTGFQFIHADPGSKMRILSLINDLRE